MGMFDSFYTSASALTAEKTRIDIISKNLANVNSTRGTGGMPYRRQMVVFQEKKLNPFSNYLSSKLNKVNNEGVVISKIVEDSSPFKLVYEPGHPDADENGYVKMSNVEPVKEMVDMIDAQRAYEANITAMNATKALLMKSLEIGRK
ncbi:flagellar basal body rod protein FlgC [Sporanaerobacter acetigenes]|uniref:Flagellar basal-body rod protein FlgC n=1 Tax=Sporanaerobacter acetigenes DSM 13106 TaxID=1123281 RepID=A0A1M5Y0R9_9FIRM|nr:flagellar basal body rod protein FlgC [Sporanaerobacter acetigenes]SHI05123.1 flagellar basal-body rod protein FlgC [Sporanaerobacter acetigenes DSM 13106]